MSELYQKAQANLQKIWGFPDFRPGQDKAISSVLEGKDTLVLFPTGGGKSLCYQVPATVLDGITIVVSPLVALMQDQVDQAKKLGIKATLINSTISRKEVEQRLINARNGMYSLLYLSPERLQTDLWQSELPQLPISMVAIDEAHCISEWGHDFRPPYRKIKESFATYTGDIRWLALTATATPEVREDICNILDFKNPNIISTGFNRSNLRWWVIREEQKEKRILNIVKKAEGSGLIYAGTRHGCEHLAKMLTQAGFPTEAYHAGLKSEQRNDIQQRWIDGSLPLVVATNAFGMGIDKPDCRFVVHFDVPYSMESYYQEAGRAGRDGELSFPIILYRKSDESISTERLSQSYPNIDIITNVYKALCDHWEIAVNSEMPELELIDINSISRRSKIHNRQIEQALEILKQIGIIELISHFKEKISIRFTGTLEGIRSQISGYKNAQKSDFADRLHRIFGPQSHQAYFDHDLDYLLEKLQVSKNALLKGLQVFQNEQLLQFRHLESTLMGRLLFERTKKLTVDVQQFNKHREVLFSKLEKMHLFLATQGCRSAYVRRYFGEENVPNRCENCDYCLNTKSAKDDELHQQVYKAISEGANSSTDLKNKLSYKTSDIKESINYLVREEKIYLVEEGRDILYRAKE